MGVIKCEGIRKPDLSAWNSPDAISLLRCWLIFPPEQHSTVFVSFLSMTTNRAHLPRMGFASIISRRVSRKLASLALGSAAALVALTGPDFFAWWRAPFCNLHLAYSAGNAAMRSLRMSLYSRITSDCRDSLVCSSIGSVAHNGLLKKATSFVSFSSNSFFSSITRC